MAEQVLTSMLDSNKELRHVARFLAAIDLFYFSLVSRACREAVLGENADTELWEPLCRREYNPYHRLVEARHRPKLSLATESAKKKLRKAVDKAKTESGAESWRDFYRHFSGPSFWKASVLFSDKYDRPAVEQALLRRPSGTYVVRPSSSGPQNYVLSVNVEGFCQHHLICTFGPHRGCMLLSRHFNTLPALLWFQDAVILWQPLAETEEIAKLVAKAKKKALGHKKEAQEALVDACKWALCDVAMELFARHPDLAVDCKDHLGRTALLWAAQPAVQPARDLKASKDDVLAELIRRGADCNVKDARGDTPLLRAVNQGWPSTQSVRALLAAGADPNVFDQHGKTALLVAVEWGHVELVAVLLEQGKVDPTQRGHPELAHGVTALHVAAASAHASIMDLLLAKGVPVDVTDSRGRTALSAPVSRTRDWIGLYLFGPPFAPMPDFQIMAILLDRGARINASDNEGNTAIHLAVQGGFRSACKVLADCGASLDLRNNAGQLPYDLGRAGFHAPAPSRALANMRYLAFVGMDVAVADFENMLSAYYEYCASATEPTTAAGDGDGDGDEQPAAASKAKSTGNRPSGKAKKRRSVKMTKQQKERLQQLQTMRGTVWDVEYLDEDEKAAAAAGTRGEQAAKVATLAKRRNVRPPSMILAPGDNSLAMDNLQGALAAIGEEDAAAQGDSNGKIKSPRVKSPRVKSPRVKSPRAQRTKHRRNVAPSGKYSTSGGK